MKRAVKAQTTDKLLLLATNGKIFTLAGDQLPGGRGHGEPVRLMVDLEENHDFVEIFVHEPGRKLLVASTAGYGFIVPEDEVVASTRKGKQVLNVDEPEEACVCVPVEGDMVATIGENRKMLIFPLDEVNEMTRGKGVILQRFKDGGLSDAARLQEERRPDLARPGGPHLHAAVGGAEGLGRPARAGRAAGAPGLPQVQQVRAGVLRQRSEGARSERWLPCSSCTTCAAPPSGRWVALVEGGGIGQCGGLASCWWPFRLSRWPRRAWRRRTPRPNAARAISKRWSTRRRARCARLPAQNTPQFQAKLRQLKAKRGWSDDQFLKEAEPLVRDDKIAGFDQKSEEFLARITSGGQAGASGEAPDCKLLAELRAIMGSLVETQKAKWAYMFEKIEGELRK